LASGEGLPGLDGMKVELRVADSRTDPAEGRAEAERLIDEGADIILGAFNSGVTRTVSQATEQEGIPHVSNASSAPELTERGFDWFFRSCASNVTSVQNQYEMLNDINEEYDAGMESVAIIHEDTDFGAEVAELQEEFANDFGFELALDPIAYTAESVSSLESQLAVIRDAEADVIFPTSYLRDGLLLMEDLQSLDYSPSFICAVGAGFGQEEFYEEPVTEFTAATSSYASGLEDVIPELSTYGEYMEEAAGVTPSFIYMNTWGGVISMLHAVDNAGSTDPEAIRDALRETVIEDPAVAGLPHGIQYDDTNHNQAATTVVVQNETAGPRMVWSGEDGLEDELEFPYPAWDSR